MLDPVGTFQKLRFEDLGVFVRIVIFLFPLTIVFLLSLSRPPRGMSEQKNSFTLSVQSQSFVGAGSGIRLSATIPKCLRTCSGNSFSGAYGRDANRLTKIPNRRA